MRLSALLQDVAARVPELLGEARVPELLGEARVPELLGEGRVRQLLGEGRVPGLLDGARVPGPHDAKLEHHAGAADPLIRAVVQSHDAAGPGALFVARRGARFDGHDHLAAAVARGAVAVIGERPALSPGVPYLSVPDARRLLPHLAAAFHGHPSRSLRVIGVTGTDGKTTTSFLLHRILSRRFPTGLLSTAGIRLGDAELPTVGHFTTPEATDVQRLLAEFVAGGASHAVLESSSHGFALHRLDAVDYQSGVVTNLSPEHLDYHKTLAAYLDAKATLLRRSKRAVVNLDDPHHGPFVAAAVEAGATVVGYGQAEAADVRLDEPREAGGGLAFTLEHGGQRALVRLPMIGRYNAWNAAAAVAAALGEGLALAEAAAALEGFAGVPGRMQVVQAAPYAVVVDFAHTGPALTKALAAVRRPSGRLLVVIGAAGERDPGKREPLGRAAVQGADLAIFTEEDSRSEPVGDILRALAGGAEGAGGRVGDDYLLIPDRGAAIAEALARARPGDVVILAGKGHERTLERADEVLEWDEAALARRLLAGAGAAGEG